MTKRIIKSNHDILFAPYEPVELWDDEHRDVYSELAYLIKDLEHPCVFTDENGGQYISSPDCNFEIEYFLLIFIGVMMPYLIALSLWIGGVL